MSELVSILIPCYNTERWIAHAIQSALDQTYPYKEVIVVDDGSTDESANIIKSFGDRIRFEIAPHRGGNPTRNRLLELAGGEWLQYLDADDYLLPDKIERYMAEIKKDGEVDLMIGPCIVENTRGRRLHRRVKRIPTAGDPWILVSLSRVSSTSGPLWRRQAVIDVGRWADDQPRCQEFDLYSRLLIGGKRFAFTSYPGTVKRRWKGNAKPDRRKAQSLIMEIQARLEEHLRSHSQLTPERQQAINEARFNLAREAWRYDSLRSMSILKVIERSQPGFIPRQLPWAYAVLYHLLGFRGAQVIVNWRRAMLSAWRRARTADS
jgi:hypothetical protein